MDNWNYMICEGNEEGNEPTQYLGYDSEGCIFQTHSEPLAAKIANCVNACAGLDMSNVPAGAVRELVNAAQELFESQCNTVCGEKVENCDFGSDLKRALAPFKNKE